MKERLNNILSLLNNALGLFLTISFIIAFFVLIFKPFPLDHFNFDDRLLFVFGLGTIIFFMMIIVRIVYPGLVNNFPEKLERPVLSKYSRCIVLWLLSSSLISIYLIYPGSVNLNMFLVFKVVLICLVPSVILIYHDKKTLLVLENEMFSLENETLQKEFKDYKDKHKNKSLELIASNNNEKINLPIADVVFLNSADNYVEIHYKESEKIKKKLLRNTLKNIEFQLNAYHNFLRCHRKFIVNSKYIDTLNGNCNQHQLILKGYKNPIPVSRQYFYRIKDAL